MKEHSLHDSTCIKFRNQPNESWLLKEGLWLPLVGVVTGGGRGGDVEKMLFILVWVLVTWVFLFCENSSSLSL